MNALWLSLRRKADLARRTVDLGRPTVVLDLVSHLVRKPFKLRRAGFEFNFIRVPLQSGIQYYDESVVFMFSCQTNITHEIFEKTCSPVPHKKNRQPFRALKTSTDARYQQMSSQSIEYRLAESKKLYGLVRWHAVALVVDFQVETPQPCMLEFSCQLHKSREFSKNERTIKTDCEFECISQS